jgi:dipeptide/tripeptide permease
LPPQSAPFGPISGRRTGKDLQIRVALALALIFVAKGFTILMPYTFKWATDAMVAVSGGKVDHRR